MVLQDKFFLRKSVYKVDKCLLVPIPSLMKRTGKSTLDFTFTKGPGNVGKALGISKKHSGLHLLDEEIHLIDDGLKINQTEIGISGRIGVASAGADASLPYRFYVRGNKFVSGKNK